MCGGVMHDISTIFESTFEVVGPSLDDNNTPTAPVTNFPTQNYSLDPTTVATEYFGHTTFTEACSYFANADPDPAHGTPAGWQQLSTDILQAAESFQQRITAAHTAKQWEGATADAIWSNVQSSFPIPTTLSSTANVMHALSQAFSNTISTVRNDLLANQINYEWDLWKWPFNHEEIAQEYNHYAQTVLESVYQPNIQQISDSNPSVNAPPAPQTNVPSGGPGGPNGLVVTSKKGSAKSGGVPATVVEVVPVSEPSTPPSTQLDAKTTSDPSKSTTTQQTSPNSSDASDTNSATPSSTSASDGSASDLSSALPALGEAAEGPMQGIQSALGQAMNAGRGAGNAGALGGASGLGTPPLRDGALRSLGGAKGGAGGGPSGAGAGPSIGKPASAPATAAGTTADRTVAAGYRAGLSSAPGSGGMGAPGAGAPAAGHQGANAQAAPHQPSKMLRRKKNGEELIGDTDAVVPVLGAPAHKEDVKPDATVDTQRDWAFAGSGQRAKKAPNPMQPSP